MTPPRPAITWEYLIDWCTVNQVSDESKITDDHGRWLVSASRDGMAMVLEFSFNEVSGRPVITLGRLKEIAALEGAGPDDRLLAEDAHSYYKIVDLAEGYDENGVQDTLRLQRRYR